MSDILFLLESIPLHPFAFTKPMFSQRQHIAAAVDKTAMIKQALTIF